MLKKFEPGTSASDQSFVPLPIVMFMSLSAITVTETITGISSVVTALFFGWTPVLWIRIHIGCKNRIKYMEKV